MEDAFHIASDVKINGTLLEIQLDHTAGSSLLINVGVALVLKSGLKCKEITRTLKKYILGIIPILFNLNAI